MGVENGAIYCACCKVQLQPQKRNLDYLGHRVTHEFLCCPVCGELYIPEELVSGRMREVETMLEDK